MTGSMMLSKSRLRPSARLALLGCALGVLAGCAGYQAHSEGKAKLSAGETGAGLAKLKEAVERDPQNARYRQDYFTNRERVVNSLADQAEAALGAGNFDVAKAAFARILEVEPANARARGAMERTAVAQRHWSLLDAALAQADAGDLDGGVVKAQQVLSEEPTHRRGRGVLRQLLRKQAEVSGKELGVYPALKAAYRMPVTMAFQNASLRQVLDALKLASGLNFMIERDVRSDLMVNISVTKKPVEDVLRLILATNQLERKVLDGDTILIYPNTPSKASEYREMVVRSFYLSNAEAAKVAASLKTLTKARDVVVDEKLNMVVVRDSAEVIRMAEKVIAAIDIAEPEVMLDLEVLEVNVNRVLDMGIRWPDSLSASVVGAAGQAGQLTLEEFRNRSEKLVRLNTNSSFVSAQLKSQAGESNLLANPRVRVRNKQPAKVLIGQRVPVITTTATANVGTSQSVNYLDVGLKLEIEPTISLDDEVSMKIGLEVSNIIQTIPLTGGSQAYVLGTRNTSTVLRVRDGETNVLAGLIQRDSTHSNTGVPGLNELPLLNRLFGSATDNNSKTEIVLLITPRIVRNLDVPGIGQQEFLSGTDAAVGAAPIQLGASGLAGPASVNWPGQGQGLPPGGQQPRPGSAAPIPAPAGPQNPPAPFTPPPIVPAGPGTR